MKNNLLIGQISDTHFVSNNKKLFDQHDTYQRLLDTVRTCNQLKNKPDFYILSGDLIHDDESYYKEFFEICKNLERPIYPMMGNHDKRDFLKKYIQPELVDEHGYLNYTIKSNSLDVICLDTAIEDKIEGTLNHTSMQWLEKELKNNIEKPIIIFMHHPPIEIGSILFDHIKCNNGEDFINLISQYKNVSDVIFGHVHCVFQTIINEIEFSSCPSTSIQYPIDAKSEKNLNLDNQGYIKLIHFIDGKIRKEHLEIK